MKALIAGRFPRDLKAIPHSFKARCCVGLAITIAEDVDARELAGKRLAFVYHTAQFRRPGDKSTCAPLSFAEVDAFLVKRRL